MAGNEPLWHNGDLDSDANFGTSGFTALPAGHLEIDDFFSRKYGIMFWSSNENGSNAWVRNIYCFKTEVGRFNHGKTYGFSVRCLRN